MTSERAGRFDDFTVDEAIEIGRRNDPGENVPSTSRTLIAEIERLRSIIESQAVAGEAVYQIRRPTHPDPSWQEVCKADHDQASGMRGYETRTLYTTPRPAPVDAAVARDAARYRYIIKFSNVQTAIEILLRKDTLFGPEFDEAIDAALAAQQQETQG